MPSVSHTDESRQEGGKPARPCMAGSGNRCGHKPENPRWFVPPPEHDPRPEVLLLLSERFRQFFDSPFRIPTLASAYHARKLKENPLDAGMLRARRSEVRESLVSLACAMLHYCDLPTLCLAVPQAGGDMVPVSMELLAKRAGLTLRRAERAMRDLIASGLTHSTQRFDLDEETGTYTGRASIKFISPLLFELFGLKDMLKTARDGLSAKRKEEGISSKMTKTGAARMKTALNLVLGKKPSTKPTEPQAEAAAVERKDHVGSAVLQSARDLLDKLVRGAKPEAGYKHDKREESLRRARAEADALDEAEALNAAETAYAGHDRKHDPP